MRQFVYLQDSTGPLLVTRALRFMQGKVEVGSLPLCKVLLADDSQYAGWLVLVPQQNGLTVRTVLSFSNSFKR